MQASYYTLRNCGKNYNTIVEKERNCKNELFFKLTEQIMMLNCFFELVKHF